MIGRLIPSIVVGACRGAIRSPLVWVDSATPILLFKEKTMNDRIERLELSNKRLKYILTFTVAAGVLAVAMGASIKSQDVVQAEKFELIDASGDVYATWSVEKGGAKLNFHGANDTTDERLRIYAEQPSKASGIRIPGPAGQNTLVVGVSHVGEDTAREYVDIRIDRNEGKQQLGFQYETRASSGIAQYKSWISDQDSRLRNHDGNPWQAP